MSIKETPLLRILLVDDHIMFSQGLSELLYKMLPACEITLCTSVTTAITALKAHDYQYIFCDLMIPGNDIRSFISFCKKNTPVSYFIIVSSVTDIHVIKSLFSDGIDAYLSKAVNSEELRMAIEKVNKNEKFLSSDLSGKMISSLYDSEKTDLTRKELEILKMVAAGKTVVQTAAILFISQSTVMSHRRNIMKKLQLHSAAELVKYAYENNLV